MAIDEPNLFLTRGSAVAAVRSRVRAADGHFAPAVRKLEAEAADVITAGPWSVIDKKGAAPSGDPHDFVGLSAYWWPNPDRADGLPYVPRDGVVNPEQELYDGPAIRTMADAFGKLAAHAYFCGSVQSGERAAVVLERWFIDPETRMNPHLEYGGYTPGIWNGTGWGIVGTHVLVGLLEAVALLVAAGHLSPTSHDGFLRWIEAYLEWLLHSDHGRFEADRPNNHGTAYDCQVMMMAYHLGREGVARQVAEQVAYRRIGIQLEHNGQQPWEVARTKSWGYSSGNLLLLMHLADMGVRLGVDLWGYETGDGRSLRRSFDYMLPAALGRQEWPWQVIGGWSGAGEIWLEILRRAAGGFGDRGLDQMATELDGLSTDQVAANRIQLTCPAPGMS
ncbi:MAG: alginate lyase family protein [Opitutaceae bacterium]